MDEALIFGSDEEIGTQVPTQAQSVVEGSGAVLVSEYKPIPDLDYLQVYLFYMLLLISCIVLSLRFV